jgi:hypothetical protein
MKQVFETPDDGHYFFGYYDKSPLNSANDKLLACKAGFIDRMPTEHDILKIGYFDWKNSQKFVEITETRTWNWQQGCMLQWFGDGETQIIYNDLVNNKFVTIIFDMDTCKKNILPMAYYSASGDGRFLLCIDNERHAWYRSSYSYKGIENYQKKSPYLPEDGIWYTDVKSKTSKKIITLRQLRCFKPLSNMEGAIHYVEHLLINPVNKRFVFLHRWETKDGGIYARLFTANTDGSDIFLLNDSGRMSHNCWRDENQIIGWGGLKNPINSLRKYKNIVKYILKPLMPVYRKLVSGDSVQGNTKLSSIINGDSYITFTDKTTKKKRLTSTDLLRDGHPSFSSDRPNIMVTDTYPKTTDNFKQELLLFDMGKNILIDKYEYNHPRDLASSGVRCDLHPKWSKNGHFISIDSLHNGYRSMILFRVG